jgi:hypothetical protein
MFLGTGNQLRANENLRIIKLTTEVTALETVGKVSIRELVSLQVKVH